ncbi:MAG: hypothetical protein LBO70_02520 [Clostridiales Family XIII bacterium]|jgi:hypothetical protein|nr:hypothetical protein [Clostridiales Family XIII bacterium]
MARYGTLRRNLRRNIKPWVEDDAVKFRDERALFAKVLAVFVVLSLSGAFVPLVANLVFRIPDLYSFDLGRTQAVEDIGVKVNNGDVADAISSFMRHRTDSLRINAESDSGKVPLFTGNDRTVMMTLRSFLDNTLAIGFTLLALFLALCFMLVRWNRPRELRLGFMGGLAAYVAVICFPVLVIVFGGPPMWIWKEVIGAAFVPGDMMPELFHRGFFLTSWIAVTAVTLAIIIVLLSVVRRLTRHESMFLGKIA